MTEGKKLLTVTGIALAVYLALKYLLPYVVPFFIAYFLVHLLNPLTEKIRKKLPWKKEIIVGVLLFALLALCTMLFYYLYCMLTGQIRRIAVNFDYYYSCFCGIVDRCCYLAQQNFGVEVEEVKSFVYSSMDHATEQLRIYMVPGVVNYSVRYLKKVLDVGIFLLILFVSVILLMKDYDEMREKLMKYRTFQYIHRIAERMWKQGGMYLKAQATIILIITCICAAGLWLLGNPYFMILGIVIGLTDALPFIGTGSLLVPIAVFEVFQGNYKLALGYLLLFLLTYVMREFLEPRLIGSRLGVYPFVMVAVVYAGLYLYGASGVILGPVTLLLVMEIAREIFSREPVEK